MVRLLPDPRTAKTRPAALPLYRLRKTQNGTLILSK